MESRRDFMKLFAVGSLATLGGLLQGCSLKPLAYVHEMFQSKPYHIEKALREERLAVNTSHSLRRYKPLPGDPYTRESELVTLARKEKVEESFVYAQPENAWYEVGIQFKNDAETPKHKEEGHKHEGPKEEYASRTLDNVVLMFSGDPRFRPIPKASSIVFYHFHPVYLRASNISYLGEKMRRKLRLYKDMEDWIYSACIKPAPPSFGDYYFGELIAHRAGRKGIRLVERVADHSGVWEFSYSRKFNEALAKADNRKLNLLTETISKAVDSADRSMIFSERHFTPEDFMLHLKASLQQAGLEGDEAELSYTPIGKPFRPSREEFREYLRKNRLIR